LPIQNVHDDDKDNKEEDDHGDDKDGKVVEF